MSTTPAQDQARDAVVLTQHYRVSTGMTHGSPDECACGVRSLPRPGDEDVSVRRARRFAEHQAAMLAKARTTTTTVHVHVHDDEPCAPDPTETYQCAAHGAQVVEVYL